MYTFIRDRDVNSLSIKVREFENIGGGGEP